jgi:hypothetical protein
MRCVAREANSLVAELDELAVDVFAEPAALVVLVVVTLPVASAFTHGSTR